MEILVRSPDPVSRIEVKIPVWSPGLAGHEVKDSHSRTIENSKAMVDDAKSKISAFPADKEWLEVKADNLKDFATKRGRSLGKVVRFELLFAIFLPISRMAPFAQAEFARIRVTNLEHQDMDVGSILENSHNL